MAKKKWTSADIPDQKGRVTIVTGATSGLGKEAARVLAGKNAEVIMAVRNLEKGENVASQIKQEFPGAEVVVRELNLTSLESIKRFADGFIREQDRLDILINNAGIMMCPYAKTDDGFEIQMGTNHLGHFALTGYLMPLLRKTANSRIVATSSFAHYMGKINFSDINWEKRKYRTSRAYGDSKLANLYFTYELARKFKDNPDGPLATASHPGWTGTDLQRHSGFFRSLNRYLSMNVEKGVLTTLRAATDPEAKAGDFYGPSGLLQIHGYPVKVGSNRRSRNAETAQRLWQVSEKMTGVSY